MPFLLVVRHGRTAWSGDAGRIADAHVSAALVAARLGAVPPAVLSSDLRRASGTAAVVAARLGSPVVTDPALREEALGPWEGLTHADVAKRFPREYAEWRRGRSDAFAGREGLDRVAARAVPAVLRALAQGRPVVAVTHANTALALTGRLTGVDRRTWPWLPTPPTGGALLLQRAPGRTAWTLAGPPGTP